MAPNSRGTPLVGDTEELILFAGLTCWAMLARRNASRTTAHYPQHPGPDWAGRQSLAVSEPIRLPGTLAVCLGLRC